MSIFWTARTTYLLAGDECVVTKAGKQTHGLDCFFSSLQQKAVPGLSFFTLALISTRQRRSCPVSMEQMIRTEEEKAGSLAKKQAKKAKPASPRGKPGRPKGSRNKSKAEMDYYSLRFQIEFNFRDAKQFWGLEDFMNINPTAVTNAANLSLFMVDVSQVLMYQYRQEDSDFSVLDLKAYFRGYRYVMETIQMLPQKPDDNLVSQLFDKVAALGRIHTVKMPVQPS